LLWRLSAEGYRFRRTSIEKARSLLAGEGDGHRPMAPHLFPKGWNIDREGEGLMVHPGAELANIGETNSEFPERGKFVRFVPSRRDADLVERAPKAIAGMRVVMANVCRPLSGSGADEDQSKMFLKLVGKLFQSVCPVRQSRGMPNTNS
jgi:hypothetical protein